jgi:hypothetical protein
VSNILQELETQISSLKTNTTRSNIGVVREVGDGVAKIEGLSDVMLNEMIDFGNGLFGLALNLEENEVGAILMGSDRDVVEGTEVRTTGRLLSVPVGKDCSVASSIRSAILSMAKARSPRRPLIPWKDRARASSSARASASRCRRASCRLTQ